MYKDDLITEFGSEGRQRRHEEDTLQADVVTFLRWALPQNAEFWSVPNGGLRHTKVAQKLVATGTKAGVPDLHIAYKSRLYCLELKAVKGVVSKVQAQMHDKLRLCGVPTAICRSIGEVEHALRVWGFELSARLS